LERVPPAQTQRVIDFIAADLPALLLQAHGRTVQMSDGVQHTVNSLGAATAAVEPDWRTKLLSIITDPTVAYLLLLLGIYFELTSPGFGVPGVAVRSRCCWWPLRCASCASTSAAWCSSWDASGRSRVRA